MTLATASGTESYAEHANALTPLFESIHFADLHRDVLHLIPVSPGSILDIGAGTGRDAAAFAAMGHRVVAVEPTAALRKQAALLHPSPLIEWLDDSLPDLTHVAARDARFDVVMLSAVWMHLDTSQRRRAMPHVAGLTKPGGVVILSLRHGTVPEGRRMFDVSGDETVQLAEACGLHALLRLDNQPSQFRRNDATWTRLAFAK